MTQEIKINIILTVEQDIEHTLKDLENFVRTILTGAESGELVSLNTTSSGSRKKQKSTHQIRGRMTGYGNLWKNTIPDITPAIRSCATMTSARS